MITKGRYVGLIEFDFKIDLDAVGNATVDEFRENLMQSLNGNIQRQLNPLLMENTDHVVSTLTVTQQYLDVYQVEGEQP